MSIEKPRVIWQRKARGSTAELRVVLRTGMSAPKVYYFEIAKDVDALDNPLWLPMLGIDFLNVIKVVSAERKRKDGAPRELLFTAGVSVGGRAGRVFRVIGEHLDSFFIEEQIGQAAFGEPVWQRPNPQLGEQHDIVEKVIKACAGYFETAGLSAPEIV